MNSTTPDDWDYWYAPWRRIQCGRCRAIITAAAPCVVCGLDYSGVSHQTIQILPSGDEVHVAATFLGADEWTQYSLLQLMFDEWRRPVRDDVLQEAPRERRASPRLVIVLLFWTHIEVLVERVLQRAAELLPPSVRSDLFARYSSVGSRMDRLSRILLGASLHDDLQRLGRADVATHLRRVQAARNAFLHGQPESINDSLVRETVDMLPSTQLAWIEMYNDLCARMWQNAGGANGL
jgi:hypothetical protein